MHGASYDTAFRPADYTILIVDDHPENLRVLDRYLQEHGFNTLIASKGELALRRLQYVHPDLILLDVLLPDIDGFETCRRLKADPQTKDIPVIFMTALTETTQKLEGFQVGGVDYVTKPFQYEEILARITAQLQLRSLTQSLQWQATMLSKRATQLETSRDVAQQINAILQPEELLHTVVSLIQSRFAYYFVSVWLVNTEQQTLVLQTSRGGPTSLPFLPGYAFPLHALHALVVCIYHTGHVGLLAPGHKHPSASLLPELPESQIELALPLKLGTDVIGVLDIQHMLSDGFDQEDITVLEGLANQISVALHNARLYQELQQMNRRLEEMSLTDPLTGLRNRRYFVRFIHEDVAKVHRALRSPPSPPQIDLGLFLLDIDHFKVVNDTYGHDAGDRVLEQVSGLLQQACRQTDIPIRWGGEEFLVEARYADRHALYLIADRIKHLFQEHQFDIGEGQTIRVTCSIGFACYPLMPAAPAAVNWEHVVSIADQCLYIAKLSGRNGWVGVTQVATLATETIWPEVQQHLAMLVASGAVTLISSFGTSEKLVFHNGGPHTTMPERS
jgi:diguanylate cyclase (GGDEF)-like protein